jgi:hypothetical protein
MNKKFFSSLFRLLITASVPLIMHQVTIEGKDIFSLDYKALASGVILALLVVGYNYQNPNDPRYGNSKKDTEA